MTQEFHEVVVELGFEKAVEVMGCPILSYWDGLTFKDIKNVVAKIPEQGARAGLRKFLIDALRTKAISEENYQDLALITGDSGNKGNKRGVNSKKTQRLIRRSYGTFNLGLGTQLRTAT
jgi:hypothetical protein